jgi:oxygen-independent coproporphyrinogen III oxidase
MSPYSLYLHIPFCSTRCGYCDFNTYAGLEDLIPAYCQALRREIRAASRAAGEPLALHTIFFGGGTPSLLPIGEIAQILLEIENSFNLLPGAEISLEANPGTLSLDYLVDLRRAGINRLSLGVQSANPAELRLLEREHDYPQVIQSVSWARRAGFDNLNLDLIFGLPYQELESWQRSVDLTLGLHPEHLSLYALTLEHGTPLEAWARRGLLATPDPDLAADMYEWADHRLGQAGYQQYEISNWARERDGTLLACRHNLQYWRDLPYLGLGAGAHGYARGQRTANVLAPKAYIQRCSSDENLEPSAFPRTAATQSATVIDRQAELSEFMIMGLRLVEEGVNDNVFQQRFGQPLGEIFGSQISRLVGLGLLEWAGDNGEILRLTPGARLVGNQVFLEFV